VADERARLAAVLSHMADGVLIVDQDGVIRLINPVAARLLQTRLLQAESHAVRAVVHDPEVAAVLGAALAGDRAVEESCLLTLGTPGQPQVIQVVASRIPGGVDGHRILLMLQDVSVLRRAEMVRRELVANIWHELRTPVAAVKALVETLEAGALEDPEAAQDFLSRMHVEVDGLAQLVEELLELSRIESGQVALRLQAVDLGAIVVTAAERLRPQAERQGVSLAVVPASNLPRVQVDPERMQQVVVNLVHNAVKFTSASGHIRVGVERRGTDVAVSVADTGDGIAPEALGRLFERFYKTDKARTGSGTGLGLTIAKHLVQAQGGRIWAESAGEGQGSTFSFALPIRSSSSIA
jgi:two-component system phosphate regulon sensor histidine kinase PhoR